METLPQSKDLDAVKRKEKWHRLQMSCFTNHYPKINANVSDNLFDLVQEASAVSFAKNQPVFIGWGSGCAIPENTKFYDACFMAMEQTDDRDPKDAVEEASDYRKMLAKIKKVEPQDIKLPQDMEISVAFYMNEIIRKEPEYAKNFSEHDLASAYSILNRMEIPENKVGLPTIEKELQTRFPERLKKLTTKDTTIVQAQPPAKSL